MEKRNIEISYMAGAPETLDAESRMLADAACKATESSYSPYSHFQVGAAVLLEDGTVVTGSNQENAAYPSGLCAERVTIFSAGAQHPGKKIKALAIAAQTGGTFLKAPITPCGACRQVMTQFEVMPRYWSQSNPPYEVDFLIQRENDIIPVEVKSEANIASKSLRKFKELFPEQVKLRVRFSLDNLKLDDDVLNIPLFMADQTDRLIGLAMECRSR